jgi:hypothetical protein
VSSSGGGRDWSACNQALAFGPVGRPSGDDGVGHPLGGRVVLTVTSCGVAGRVALRVTGGVGSPAAPDDAARCLSEDAQRAAVVTPAFLRLPAVGVALAPVIDLMRAAHVRAAARGHYPRERCAVAPEAATR